MDLAMNDLGALVAARRNGTTLESERLRAAAPKKDRGNEELQPKAASGDDIAKALDALKAVIPASLAALYSGLVALLQTSAIAAGATARAAQEAAIVKAHPDDAAAANQALAALHVETDEFLVFRVLAAVAFGLFVLVLAWNKANETEKKPSIKPEPVIVTAAFAAWAAASPGTPLAAVMDASSLQVTTISIAFIAAGALAVLSVTVLKKKTSKRT